MKKTQKVMHIIDHTGPGGAQVVLENILREIGSEYNQSVLVLGKQGDYSQIYKSLAASVFEFNVSNKWDPFFLYKIIYLIRKEKAEIIHCHLSKANILGPISSIFTNSKVIMHDHSGIYAKNIVSSSFIKNPLIKRLYFWAYKKVLNFADKVIVVTQKDAAEYEKNYKNIRHRLEVVPNGININKYKKDSNLLSRPNLLRSILNISTDEPIFIWVGRIEPEKDLGTLLRTAKYFDEGCEMKCHFAIVGDGSQRKEIENLSGSLGLNNISFLGYRLDANILIQQSSALLLTSIRESFSLVVLEAMALGCPIISTATNGPSSILSHEETGLLAPVGDVQAIVNEARKLMESETLRKRIIENASKEVENYDTKKVIGYITDIYNGLLFPEKK